MTVARDHRPAPDWPFYLAFALIGGVYVILIGALLMTDLVSTTPNHLLAALTAPEIRRSIRLSLLTSGISTILALWLGLPLAYLLSRTRFIGRPIIELMIELPIVVPPLVVGLSLLILFQTPVGRTIERVIPVTYAVPSIILAQFTVGTALAVRMLRVTFDQIPARTEDVARTLGCSRGQAFWWVTFPQARRGLLAAATLVWARSLGEFGPILIFSGATRMKTEVLPTSIFLELSQSRIEAALAVSLLLIGVAAIVLVVMRALGLRGGGSP